MDEPSPHDEARRIASPHAGTRRGWGAALGAALFIVAGVAALPVAARHLRALGLVLSLGGIADPTGLTRLVVDDVREVEASVRTDTRSLRARAYVPRRAGRAPGVVLLHGVHPRGIDEPHLRAFARDLAARGLHVLTPEMPELIAYQVAPSTIDDIAVVTRRHAERSGGKVGVWGISFAGGLTLLAAASAQAHATFGHVVAIGAHHDLARLARYYAGREVRGPDGARPTARPHAYGARVILLAYAASIFPEADLAGARQALRLALAGHAKAAHREADRLAPPSRSTVEMLLDDRRRDEVGRLLMRTADAHAAELARVSPAGRLRTLRVPTFLVHGADDPIIPSLETLFLEREVPATALRLALVTPVLRHTEAERAPPLREYWKVVRFVAALLDEAARD